MQNKAAKEEGGTKKTWYIGNKSKMAHTNPTIEIITLSVNKLKSIKKQRLSGGIKNKTKQPLPPEIQQETYFTFQDTNRLKVKDGKHISCKQQP